MLWTNTWDKLTSKVISVKCGYKDKCVRLRKEPSQGHTHFWTLGRPSRQSGMCSAGLSETLQEENRNFYIEANIAQRRLNILTVCKYSYCMCITYSMGMIQLPGWGIRATWRRVNIGHVLFYLSTSAVIDQCHGDRSQWICVVQVFQVMFRVSYS